jgi:septal ring factor EnvC (AmiA/AmiB activator)
MTNALGRDQRIGCVCNPRPHARRRPHFGLLFAALVLLLSPAQSRAQDSRAKELRDSQARLEQIRRERELLQQQMEQLQSRVHDMSAEVANAEKLVAASAAALREIDFQTETVTHSADSTSQLLLFNRENLVNRKARMHGRLRAIYRRGPLHYVRVLLGAESFGDLLNRYKYLHLISVYDQRLVDDVSRLERDLAVQAQELKMSLDQLQVLRAEKLTELQKLRDIELREERALRGYKQRAKQTEGRLSQLARDEAKMTDALEALERARREEERRRVVAGRPADNAERALTTRDLGSLAWPVEGNLVYRFGPERKPNGVVLRNNGIGIGAPVGTVVRAVEAGTVRMSRAFEGYGPTVMISHGGGYYTLYLYLKTLSVKEGQRIAVGQQVGTVGGERTAEGPHIEFQVRAPLRGDTPEAVDPLSWLRARASQ